MYLHSNLDSTAANIKKKLKHDKKIPPTLQKMELLSADATIFKFFFSFFAHENIKKRPEKFLLINPKLFFHVLVRLPKPAQNWFLM